MHYTLEFNAWRHVCVFFDTNVCVGMPACRHKQYGNIIIMPVKFISTHRHLLLHAMVEMCRCLKNMHYTLEFNAWWHVCVLFHTNVCVGMPACWHKQYGNIIIMPVKFIWTHRHILLHAVVETCRCFKWCLHFWVLTIFYICASLPYNTVDIT